MGLFAGTKGYANSAASFVSACESVAFSALHEPILDLLPKSPSRVLDIGAGSGRDAAALAELGHTVVAVEPSPEVIALAQATHRSARITWIRDGLPDLQLLADSGHSFDFVLCHAVWQHIDSIERIVAMDRIAKLMAPSGRFALALRCGPAGLGKRYFSADADETVLDAERFGLRLLRRLDDQPSVIADKPSVTWTRLLFEKGRIEDSCSWSRLCENSAVIIIIVSSPGAMR